MKRVTHVSPSSSVAASSSIDFFSKLLMALSTSLGCNPSFNLSLALTDGKFSEGHGTMPRFEFLSRQIGSLTTFLITYSCESCHDYKHRNDDIPNLVMTLFKYCYDFVYLLYNIMTLNRRYYDFI